MGKLMTSVYLVVAVGLTWGFATVFYGAGIGSGSVSSNSSKPAASREADRPFSAEDLPNPFGDSASERARLEAQETREKFQGFQSETQDRLKEVQDFRAAKEREVQHLKQAERDLRTEAQMAEQVRRAMAEGWYKIESEHLSSEAIRAMHMAVQINRELDAPIFDVRVTDETMSIAVKVENLWSGRFPDQVRDSRRRALRSMAQLLSRFGQPALIIEHGRGAERTNSLVAERLNELTGLARDVLSSFTSEPRLVAKKDRDFDEREIAMRLEVPNPAAMVDSAPGIGGGDARSRAVDFVRGLFF